MEKPLYMQLLLLSIKEITLFSAWVRAKKKKCIEHTKNQWIFGFGLVLYIIFSSEFLLTLAWKHTHTQNRIP